MTNAEQRASNVLEQFAITMAPVPVEDIARQLGAQVAFDAFDGDVSGMLYRDGATVIIGVNSRHANTRQRFTIAHECGHLLMHEGTPMFIDRFVRMNYRDGSRTEQEREANEFAAELLMPRDLVLAEVDRVLEKEGGMPPQQLIAMLANRFRVSPDAMSIRLSNLDALDSYSLAG